MKKKDITYSIKENYERTFDKIVSLIGSNKILVDVGIDIQPNAIAIAALPVDFNYYSPSYIVPPVIYTYNEGVCYKKDKITEVSRGEERRGYRQKRKVFSRKKGRVSKLAYFLKHDGFSYEKHDNIYEVRAKGLDKKLTRDELAAVLLHITKHRGYLSNRKSGEEKEGKVKSCISELENNIKRNGSRTLGEYYFKENSKGVKVRNKYISRDMTIRECNLIMDKQQEFYPEIKDLRDRWLRIVYHQRPLKSCRELRGCCSIYEKEVRAPRMHYKSQEFILRAFLNNLTITNVNGNRKLTQKENNKLYNYLEYREKITVTQMRKKLGLSDLEILSVEKQKSKTVKGHNTNYLLKKHMGQTWVKATEEVKNDIINLFQNTYNLKILKDKLKSEIGYELKTDIPLVAGYIKYSEKALDEMLPLLRKGVTEMTAVKKISDPYEKLEQKKTLRNDEIKLLPPFENTSNPMVNKSLSNARKAFNDFYSEYSSILKIRKIRVETCKEMKKNRKQREKFHKDIKNKEDKREKIKEELAKLGILKPSRKDIMRWQLAEECNWTCVYTGKPIAKKELFKKGVFHIEHIYPRKRYNDSSFLNLTLCHADENTNKDNKTPFEAYYGTKKWGGIIKRIKCLHPIKRKRFISKEIDDSHIPASKLNATSYASCVIRRGFESAGYSVEICSGSLTSKLRYEWEISTKDKPKDRTSYLHHGEDALLIAASANLSVNTIKKHLYNNLSIPLPWQTFNEDIRKAIKGVVVNHTKNVKSNGKLHCDAFYGQTKENNVYTIRKPLNKLTMNGVRNIVDEGHKKIIMDHLQEQGINLKSTGKINAGVWKNPLYIGKNVIKKVKIYKVINKPVILSNGKVCESNSNHHIEIFDVGKDGSPNWVGRVISNWEVNERKLNNIPVINRNYIHKDGIVGKFVCSLVINDMLKMKDGNVFRIQKLTRPNLLTIIKHDKAVLVDKNKKSLSKNMSVNSLMELVAVSDTNISKREMAVQ